MTFAATFPVRLLLHYSSPTPPSRPMASVLVPFQSRECHDESTQAGSAALPPAVALGRVV